MTLLNNTLKNIKKPNKDIYEKALDRLANQIRPVGSLGILEPISARLAGIFGTLDVQLNKKMIITCAGDHGVCEEGISKFPSEVTQQMVLAFVNGAASINVLARHVGSDVKVADLGVALDFDPELPIFHKKIQRGTANFTKEPAMKRDEAVKSIEAGIEIVDEIFEAGAIDMLGTGDMGIGNTTPSTAIIAAYSGISVAELTGRGTGIDDESLQRKITAIEKGLALHQPDISDPLDLLAKVGGLEIGGLAGLVLGAAKHGIPVVCDGFIATAGALIACEMCPQSKEYLFASHNSVEKGHAFMLKHLDLEPLLDLKFRLGEGTGAALAMQLLDAATRILAEIKTFEEVGVTKAQ